MALTPSKRRRERERLAHRREILEAAERLIADKGLEAVTMEEVAQEAEFSVGALYTFFDCKEELCAEVILKIADEFQEDFQKVKAGTEDPLDTIAAVIELRLRSMEKHGKFFRYLMESKRVSRAFPDHAIPRNCVRRYQNYIESVANIWRKAVSAGRVRNLDPLYAALAMEGVINAFSAHWARANMRLSIGEQVEIVRRNFLDVVAAQPASGPGRRRGAKGSHEHGTE